MASDGLACTEHIWQDLSVQGKQRYYLGTRICIKCGKQEPAPPEATR